jgi:fumarate hydratase class II
MRKKNTESLRDVVRQVLREQQLDGKLNDKHLIEAWPVVLGQNISKYTTELSVKNRTLYVSLSSSVLRHDLFLSRHEIKTALNRHVGKEVITDIIFR